MRLVPLGVGPTAVEPREKAFEYLGREVDVAERVARLELQAAEQGGRELHARAFLFSCVRNFSIIFFRSVLVRRDRRR